MPLTGQVVGVGPFISTNLRFRLDNWRWKYIVNVDQYFDLGNQLIRNLHTYKRTNQYRVIG